MISPPNRMQESGPFADLIKQFNRLRDYAVSLRLGDGATTATRRTSYGQILEKIGADSSSVETPTLDVAEFKVQSVEAEYLVCEKLFDAATVIYNIAKPDYIRPSGWVRTSSPETGGFSYSNTNGNESQERLCTILFPDGTSIGEIQEELYPKYSAGDILLAINLDQIAVRQSNTIGELTATNGNAITWIDVNASGRHWKPVYRVIDVCVNGQTKRAVAPIGNPF